MFVAEPTNQWNLYQYPIRVIIVYCSLESAEYPVVSCSCVYDQLSAQLGIFSKCRVCQILAYVYYLCFPHFLLLWGLLEVTGQRCGVGRYAKLSKAANYVNLYECEMLRASLIEICRLTDIRTDGRSAGWLATCCFVYAKRLHWFA